VSETDKHGTTFDQASREATGARPYGRYLEDFEEGATYKHWPAKTVTEADDHMFCLITMNHHPLSKPDRGIVKVRTDVFNQRNELVATFKRAVLIPKRPA